MGKRRRIFSHIFYVPGNIECFEQNPVFTQEKLFGHFKAILFYDRVRVEPERGFCLMFQEQVRIKNFRDSMLPFESVLDFELIEAYWEARCNVLSCFGNISNSCIIYTINNKRFW